MSVTHAAITRIAEPRGNVISKRHLREELGLNNRQIERLVESRFLLVLAKGIYGVGIAVPDVNHYMRAACAMRPDVALCVSTAGSMWGMRRARRHAFELLVPTGCSLVVPFAHIRRTNRLDDCDVVEHLDGLRVTTPARTLFDHAAIVDVAALRSMAEDALNKELCTMPGLREIGARLMGKGRGGTRLFAEFLEERPDDRAPMMSELELVLADALRAAGLPVEPQRRLVLPTGRAVYLDLAIERSRTDVEVDHHEWHAGLVETQRDKTRDIQVSRRGWQTLRFTDVDIERRLPWVVNSVVDVDRSRTALLRPA